MQIGLPAFDRSNRSVACSAIRMRGLSRWFGAQKNQLRHMRAEAFRMVRSQASPRSRSSDRRLAHISGVRGAARQVPALRQGEARATGIPGGQSALHQAVCILCRPALPQLSDPGCCKRAEAGLAHSQGARQAVHACSAGQGWNAGTDGDRHRRDLGPQGPLLSDRGQRPHSRTPDLVWRQRSLGGSV